MREKTLRRLLFAVAVALLASLTLGCNGISLNLDCRATGCPSGQECAPTAKPAESGGYGCRPLDPPAPPPVVEPSEPPPIEPQPGGPYCDATLSVSCWHMPPGLGEWLWRCWDGTTDVRNSADCSPKPEPAAGCSIDGEPGAPIPGHPMTAKLADAVDDAMLALRPMCTVGSRCLLGDMTLQAWQAEVIRELRKRGVCAGQHEPGVTDEIAVAATATDPREGYHVAAGDDSSGPVPPGGVLRTVVWSRGAYRGAWAAPNYSKLSNSCGDPVPPGVGRVKVVIHNVGPNRTRLDATQYVHSWEYCREVGFTDGRLFCAMRPEGHPEREACEALFPIRWSGVGFADETNPNLWIVPRGTGGTVTACAGTECQSIEVAP